MSFIHGEAARNCRCVGLGGLGAVGRLSIAGLLLALSRGNPVIFRDFS